MSLLTYEYESQYLSVNTQITVILPDKPREMTPVRFYQCNRKYKALWLLHGTFGDHTDWIRKTNIELYAAERNLAVIMPSASNSNYSNWNHYMLGYSMYDYLIKELMPLIYGWFPVSDKRIDNFIAGLSMGGRGAVKYAVNYPEKFAGAAILSAVPVNFDEFCPGHDNPFLNPEDFRMKNTLKNSGGLNSYIHSEENVWAILDKLAPSGTLPKLFFACGENDALLYSRFLSFQEHCRSICLEAEWFSLPGYSHEWRFWDLSIQKALDFFSLQKDGGNPF